MKVQKKLHASLLLSCMAMLLLGVFYIVGAPNFGKAIVGWWGILAIPLALAALAGICVRREGLVSLCCLLFALMQCVPLGCWLFLRDGFYVFGVFVFGIVGGAVHLLLLLWSYLNYKLLSQVAAW